MPSDFSNLELAGKVCMNCGVSGSKQKLMRLNTYSLSLSCYPCWVKHINCADCKKSCTKDPHSNGPCTMCGCAVYRHGLENEFDRQYAACVGMPAHSGICTGFAGRECGRLVFAGHDGVVPRLCDTCMPEWIKGVKQTMAEAAKVMDAKEMSSITGPEAEDVIH